MLLLIIHQAIQTFIKDLPITQHPGLCHHYHLIKMNEEK